MPRYQGVRFASLFVLTCVLAYLLRNHALASTVSFTQIKAAGQSSNLHADLNNDGREDFVYFNVNTAGFEVALSNPDGTYAAPVSYKPLDSGQATSVGIGDFNNDGQADIVVFSTTNTGPNNLYLYLNDGKGHFSEKAAFPTIDEEIDQFVIADFNHDGIMDIAFLNAAAEDVSSRASQDSNGIQVWFGDGKSGFTVGPVTPTQAVGELVLGDFDGDGKADLALEEADPDLPNDVSVFYGDGTGYFPVQRTIQLSTNSSAGFMDVNGDGKTDVVVTTYPAHHMNVYYGNSNRAWTENAAEIRILHCFAGSIAADVNGDGIRDLIVSESSCGQSKQDSQYVGVLTRNSDGTYNPDQIVYTVPSSLALWEGPTVLRANLDAKPDVSLTLCAPTECDNATSYTRITLLNTTSSKFHRCEPPSAFEGINVCSPKSGSTVASPVSFNVGAAGQVPMRKVEVWIDGKKAVQQFDGFSNYTFLDQSLDLFTGSHRVAIFAGGWDNSLQKKVFTLEVK